MERIEELTIRWLDGVLTTAEATELSTLCAASETACQKHLELLQLEAALRGLGQAPQLAHDTLAAIEHSGSADLERMVMRAIGNIPHPDWLLHGNAALAPPGSVPRSSHRWIWLAVASLSAAIVLVAVAWRPRHSVSFEASLPELTSITERIELLDTGNQPLSVQVQKRIGAGETLVAHEDDRALLIYSDETKVELYGPSRLQIFCGPDGEKRLKLLAGSMRLDVRPQPADRPLIVSTPQGEVRVLGTRFRLATSDERTRLEMEEGQVAFSHADGRTVEVSRGAYVVAEESIEPVAVQPLPPTLVAPLWSRPKVAEALAMSANGELVAVASRSGSILVLNAATGELQHEIPGEQYSGGPPSKLIRLAFAERDQRLVGITEHGQVIRWNILAGESELLDAWGATFALRILASDGSLVGRTVGGGWQPKVRIWRLPTASGLAYVRDIGGENDTWSTAFSPCGSWLAFGTRIGWVHVEDIDSGAELWRQRVGEETVRRLAFSADRRWLALYSPGLGIQVRSLADGSLAAGWLPEGPAVSALAFSPDGEQLAAGLADHTVRFWSVSEGRPALIIETGHGGAHQIAFSPDGRRLATVGQNAAVWELPYAGSARTSQP